MTESDWINVIALLSGPLIGVLITIVYQRLQERKRAQLWVFGQLVANRHQIVQSDNVKAMNTIDVVFAHNQKVRAAWADFVTAMRTASTPQEERLKKYNAMIDIMSSSLGYGSTIRYLDFDRMIYDPAPAQAKAIEQALLELLNFGKQYVESEVKKLGQDKPKD